MKERIMVLLVTMTLLSILLTALPVTGSENDTWIPILHVSTAVVYDYDNDGFNEIVADSYILEGDTVITSPYPHMNVTLADVNGDGKSELVFYGGGTARVYDHTSLIGIYNVSDVEPVVNNGIIAFGGDVIWNGRMYHTNATKTIPIDGGHTVFTVFFDGEKTVLVDMSTKETYTIYNGFIDPLGGVYSNGYIYVIGSLEDGRTIVVKYNLGSTSSTIVYNVNVDKVLWVYPDGEFLVRGDNSLYDVTFNSILLLSTWYPLGSSNDVIFLYNNGEISVFSIHDKRSILSVTLPLKEKPSGVFTYPNIVVSYTSKSYLLQLYNPLYLYYTVEPYEYVGERVQVSVTTNGNYSILADGISVPENNIVFNTSGVHNITIYASLGYYMINETVPITILPRPLLVELKVNDTPIIYSPMKIKIETYDEITDKPVNLTCRVSEGDYTFHVKSWETTEIPSLPSQETDDESMIKVNCGNGIVYENYTDIYYVPLNPANPVPVTSILGDKVKIDFIINNTDKQVKGEAIVYLNNTEIYRGETPLYISIPNGTSTYTIVFNPYDTMVNSLTYNLTVKTIKEEQTNTTTTTGVISVTGTNTPIEHQTTSTTTNKETTTPPQTTPQTRGTQTATTIESKVTTSTITTAVILAILVGVVAILLKTQVLDKKRVGVEGVEVEKV